MGLITSKNVKTGINKEGKEVITSVRYQVSLVRRPNVSGYVRLGALRFDEVTVYARSNDIQPNGYALVKHMAKDSDVGDIVNIKGTISSKELHPVQICPKCGTRNSVNASIIYIDPTYVSPVRRGTANVNAGAIELPEDVEIMIRTAESYNKNLGRNLRRAYANLKRSNAVGDALNEEQAKDFLRKAHEFSNNWYGTMTLLGEPTLHTFGGNGTRGILSGFCAVNRLRHIYSDPSDKMTDYMNLCIYGTDAVIFSEILHYQSTITVNASIGTRPVKRPCTCSKCGHEYVIPIVVSEIVPYHVEFGGRCTIPQTGVVDADGNPFNDYEDDMAQMYSDAEKNGTPLDYMSIIEKHKAKSGQGADDENGEGV